MDPLSPDNPTSSVDRSRFGACRECKRSKIRCSRIFPCQACTRRGCADICPDGIKEIKRTKADETLMHENARLVRRIQHLEGILLSLKHPVGFPSSPDDTPPDPPSPTQDSQSPKEPPSRDFSDPTINGVLGSAQDWDPDLDSLFEAAAKNHEDSHLRRGGPDLAQGSMRALETRLERDKSILAPGCNFSDTQTPFEMTASEDNQSVFSKPVPASSSFEPFSEVPSRSNCYVSTENTASRGGTGHVDWNIANTMPTLPSVSNGDRLPPTTLLPSGQFGESPFQSGQSDTGQSDELMSAELCHRLFAELGIPSQETPGAWSPL